MPTAVALSSMTTANRWLLLFSLTATLVLLGGTLARRAARKAGGGSGVRRRAGALLALGPVIGLALAPYARTETVVAAAGAAVLAAVGLAVERSRRADALTLLATIVAAAAAVAAGARFGPTGVEALDVVLAFLFVVVVTQAADGLRNIDGLAIGIGAASAFGLFALSGFDGQDDLASVALGLGAACFAFVAFNLRPASLFVGRAGRLAVGYTVAVGALTVHVVPSAPRSFVTSLMLVGVLLVDAAVVVIERLRRRQPLGQHRTDHLVHRLAVLGWSAGEAVALLVLAQVLLSTIAVFTGRGVLPLWLGALAGALIAAVLAGQAARARLTHADAPGIPLVAKLVLGAIGLIVLAGIVPFAFVADDARGLMESGREAASRALTAARDGDAITASAAFHEAALTFGRARDKLDSPFLSGGLAVPLLAPNVRAARALADIGTDLANVGESVTTAVDPEALKVIDGRLPLEEVRRLTPKLREGSQALSDALARLDDVRDDPYLLGPVREVLRKVHRELARADREGRHAAAAAELAPAIFGGPKPRTYLLVVQNNAESRATGGFIGSYGPITAQDGKLDLGDLLRTGIWNNAVRALPDVTLDVPDDYRTRYTQFEPATTLQNINLSPDFPSVGRALMSLAPQAGVGKVDGVLAVDPQGLAALLELTGPIDVPPWPTDITSANVVNVTLRDAYAAFADTPERADFLGDVAQVAVDTATDGDLGAPAHVAKILGRAAHGGHIILAFARPREQRLAEQLGVSGRMARVQSDAIALTSSNSAANKIDYYLRRSVRYTARIQPSSRASSARVRATFDVTLDNTAPNSGLPQIVIGPFDPRFVAGVNRSFVSIYSPLHIVSASMNGSATPVSPGLERGRNVFSVFIDIPARSHATLETRLGGRVKLHDGWYDVVVQHQPTLVPDRVFVSVDVPKGWRIDRAPGMARPFAGRASAIVDLDRTRTFRVHIAPDPGTWDLWQRLEEGA